MVGNCSSVAAYRNSIRPAAESTAMPASGEQPEVRRTGGQAVADLLGVGGAELVHDGRVHDDRAEAVLQGEPGRLDEVDRLVVGVADAGSDRVDAPRLVAACSPLPRPRPGVRSARTRSGVP